MRILLAIKNVPNGKSCLKTHNTWQNGLECWNELLRVRVSPMVECWTVDREVVGSNAACALKQGTLTCLLHPWTVMYLVISNVKPIFTFTFSSCVRRRCYAVQKRWH